MPTLDTYRKQAKQLLRWHAGGDYSIGEKVRRLERFASLSDREVLAAPFPLALAQEIVAVEAGCATWAELKATADAAPRASKPAQGPPRLLGVAPVLLVRDVALSAGFWRDALGFAIDFLHGSPPFYGAVSRDGVGLHLRFVHHPPFAQAAAEEPSVIIAHVEVLDVRGLYEEATRRGFEPAQKLTKHPWGGTDFHLRDLDGNVVAFVGYGTEGR